jgi:hypothetical protein
VKARLSAAQLVRLLSLCFLCFAAMALPAFAQNCALCYTQAASSGAKMIAALKSGILILVIPPTLASVGMIFVVHHRRNQTRRTDDDPEWYEGWTDADHRRES